MQIPHPPSSEPTAVAQVVNTQIRTSRTVETATRKEITSITTTTHHQDHHHSTNTDNGRKITLPLSPTSACSGSIENLLEHPHTISKPTTNPSSNVTVSSSQPTPPSSPPTPEVSQFKRLSPAKRMNSDSEEISPRTSKRRGPSFAITQSSYNSDENMSFNAEDEDEDDSDSNCGFEEEALGGFACPLQAFDPQKYSHCYHEQQHQGGFRNLKEVRQHIQNAHRRKPFCPICRATFPTAWESDQHIRSRTCSLRTAPEIEGVHEDRMDELARWRFTREESHDKQWRAIADIILPSNVGKEARQKLQPRISSTVVQEADSDWVDLGKADD
ncbi:hypothetical protein B0H63DRAFT_472807 [Podospora didyma]|uniref:Uncharacterized protein n=1 Tax=Podospora didyma TaxID=330526 RepID=A0AAE0NPL8_9PEZI|nr:hypothetical protein B0H63DRAFT_472807 [Podospora didyma]